MGRFNNKLEVQITRSASGRPQGMTFVKEGKVVTQTGIGARGRTALAPVTPNLPIPPRKGADEIESGDRETEYEYPKMAAHFDDPLPKTTIVKKVVRPEPKPEPSNTSLSLKEKIKREILAKAEARQNKRRGGEDEGIG